MENKELFDEELLDIKRQEELIAELEPESKYRTLTPIAEKVCIALCLILSLFHIYTAGFGVLQEYEHRAFHLSFVLCLIFVCYNIRRREPPRKKSIKQSTIYGILGGTLFSMMLGKVLGFSVFTYVLTAVGLGFCLFYFKERVHLPTRIMPPVDLLISLTGLVFVASLLIQVLPSVGQVKQTSGWPLILWGVGIFSSVLFTFAWQAVQSLRWCLRGPADFKLHPLQLPYFDIVFALIAFAVSSYIIVDFDQFIIRGGMANESDYLVGVFAIALVLKGTRRSAGVPLTMIAFVALIYCYVGPYLQDIPVLQFLAHRGYTVGRVIEHMYAGTEGIYGIPLGVCATFVFHFVLFGLFIAHTGLGKFFIDLAMAVAGGSPGGPAKVSIIASGFFGMISGSSIANCVTIGSFTIPMMKKIGYRPEFAGAVEASASTGGQIMPPVMGAAAFVMSEWLGIPYLKICLAATIPAILHFYAIGTMVHFEALKNNMSGLPKEMLPRVKDVLRERGILVLPLIVIMYLLIAGYTPFLAAFWAIILSTSLGQFHSRTWNFLVAIFLTLPSICMSYTPFADEWYFSLAWFGFLGIGMGFAYLRSPRRDWLISAIPIAVFAVLGAFDVKPFLMAFWANMVLIAIGCFYTESKMRLPMIIDALEKGTLNALAIGAAVASVGIIIGMTMLTGLGLKFGGLTIQMARYNRRPGHANRRDAPAPGGRNGSLLHPVLHRFRLLHPRHGVADDGPVHCGRGHRRPGPAEVRSASVAVAHVRLLLRHPGRRNASGGPRRLCRGGYRGERAVQDRSHRNQPLFGQICRAFRLGIQPGHAPHALAADSGRLVRLVGLDRGGRLHLRGRNRNGGGLARLPGRPVHPLGADGGTPRGPALLHPRRSLFPLRGRHRGAHLYGSVEAEETASPDLGTCVSQLVSSCRQPAGAPAPVDRDGTSLPAVTSGAGAKGKTVDGIWLKKHATNNNY